MDSKKSYGYTSIAVKQETKKKLIKLLKIKKETFDSAINLLLEAYKNYGKK